MNQARIWCVVSPNVGLPLLLGSVTVIALLVHATVLSHTPWFGNYWSGSARGHAAAAANDTGSKFGLATGTAQAAPAFAVTVAPLPAAGSTQTAFVVTVTPNPGAKAAPAAPSRLALATPR